MKKHLLSTCTVRVSYLEIYNEQCYDLLDISAQPSDIAIIEDSKDRVLVKGLAAPMVNNEAEALQCLFEVSYHHRQLLVTMCTCSGLQAATAFITCYVLHVPVLPNTSNSFLQICASSTVCIALDI